MNKNNRSFYFSLCFSIIPFLVPAQCASFPVVNLGTDTAICDTAFILDAGNPGMNFLWSTSASTQQINANTSGAYSVTVTDSLGCPTSDTINLMFNPPSVAGIIALAGGDTILCGNDPSVFYSTGHTGYVLWWVMDTINWVWAPFGSGDTLDYGPSPNNMSGVYTIMATTTNGNCPADTANILNVALHSSPEVDLGPDDTLCGFQTYLYSGYPGEQNLWNTGDTTDYTVADTSGTYIVTVTFQNGCRDSDTVAHLIFPWPTVTYSCPADSMCINDGSLLLVPGTPAGGSFVGINVSSGYFNPVMGGSNLVVYTWTDTISGCVGAAGDYIWVDTCVGVIEFEDTQLSVYPNPATSSITIDLLAGEHTIEILDMQGRTVRTICNTYSEKELVTDITSLDDGAYMISISGVNGIRCERFIKQNTR